MREVLIEALEITGLVYVLMVLVELMELRVGQSLRKHLTENRAIQYLVSAGVGTIPNCGSTSLMVTLYMAGIVSFGALLTAMVCLIDDSGVLLLSCLADKAMRITISDVVTLWVILVTVGIAGGVLAESMIRKFRIRTAAKCLIPHHNEFADKKFRWGHFLTEHAYHHIFLKHIPALFLWMLGSLTALYILESRFQLSEHLRGSTGTMILLGALVGLLPSSTPQLIFVTLFGKGIIGLPVLAANSIVQEGHGLLPLLSFSVSDAIKIKAIKFVFGLVVGYGLWLLNF